MYRPGAGTVRQTRYQGMGNCAPDIRARERAVNDLLKDAIQDEVDAISKYDTLLDVLQSSHMAVADRMKFSEILTNILNQERQHKALLERLRM